VISTYYVLALTSEINLGDIVRKELDPDNRLMNTCIVPAVESLTDVKVAKSPVSESFIAVNE
jgi:hypothetical protein